MDVPNGSVITPDGKALIVAETCGACLTAFEIGGDAGLSNRRVWAPLPNRAPDGICLNADGNIWVANAVAPECILVAPGGKILEVIDTDVPCFACMLGGDDGRTLCLVVAPTWVREEAKREPRGKLLPTRVDVPHAGLP
jgi:sugar lactone lactonase YvrE